MITGQASKPGEKLHKIVVAKRPKVYTEKYFNEDTREWEEIEIGHGWEIVKEVNASDDGLSAWNALTPEEQEKFARNL
jgi:hypothetical protein